ncbi:class I SAM-dependent methyltransferase [Enterococcus faecium]|nr:class I SAM-dependent methyltransferase [Enterococcus faecium]
MYYKNSKYLSKDTATNYDLYLPEYFFFDNYTKSYKEEIDIIISNLDSKIYNTILELGVGTGRITEKIIPFSENYIGLDISESMIDKITRKLANNKADFFVYDINEFIRSTSSLDNVDFLCSFWAFNYSVLAHFERKNFNTNTLIPCEDLNLAEKQAIDQIVRLLSLLNPGTDFLFFYFDTYSVEQSYVTTVLEQQLPFPHNDRGYTFKVFKKALSFASEYSNTHLNGYVYIKNDKHLLDYFKTLHLKGAINTSQDEQALINHFSAYKKRDGTYKIPAGVNVVKGKTK